MSNGFTREFHEPTVMDSGTDAAVSDEALNDPAEAAAYELLRRALEAAYPSAEHRLVTERGS
ncbi:hypothetical protein [Azospirillum sp. TSH64]|uniref:hypothetical protein n=1 Tax=Azospirillum sp. TSH64 TaxID=652740 RepID=UPI0011B20A02|nr:hypothetical protein [Azospirillum sp. TSH64]